MRLASRTASTARLLTFGGRATRSLRRGSRWRFSSMAAAGRLGRVGSTLGPTCWQSWQGASQLQSLWIIPTAAVSYSTGRSCLTAAIPMDNPCCSCELTRDGGLRKGWVVLAVNYRKVWPSAPIQTTERTHTCPLPTLAAAIVAVTTRAAQHSTLAVPPPSAACTGTPSPRAFIFSVENAVCEDSYRCQCRRNRLLRSLPTLTSFIILTDSVL